MRAKLLLVSLVTTLSLFFFGYSALADEIAVNEERIYVEITSDGTVRVYDNIVFDITGSYNGVYKQISYDKADSIRITKVQEAINPQKVNTDFEDYELVESAEKGDKGVYTLVQDGDDITVNIYAPSEDTYRGFRIAYELKGAVNKYNDVSELYWKFIDNDNETPIKRLEIYVTYPEGSTADTIRAYGHGPENGAVRILDDRNAIFTVDNLDSNTMVEIRALMPSEILSAMDNTINEEMLDKIIAEEKGYTNDAIKEKEKQQEVEKFGRVSPLIAILLNSIAAVFMVLKLKRPKYNQYQKEAIDIEAYDPVLLSYYVQPYSTGTTRGIIGELLNLVRKGFLSIEPLKEDASSDISSASKEPDLNNAFGVVDEEKNIFRYKDIEVSNDTYEAQDEIELGNPRSTNESYGEYNTEQNIADNEGDADKEAEALEEDNLADGQEDRLQEQEHEEAESQEERNQESEEAELQEEYTEADEEAEADEEEKQDDYDGSQASEPWGNSRIVRTDKKESLPPQEEFLIKWFVEEIGDGSSVTLKELTDYFRSDEEAPEKIAKWNEIIADEIEGLGYKDKSNIKYKPLIAIGPIAAAVLSTIALVTGNAVGLAALLLSLGLTVAVIAWPSRSQEGQRAYDNFCYIKEKLKNFKQQDAKELIANMKQGELYMVYAAMLNLKDDFIESMSAGFGDNYQESLYTNYYLWSFLYMGGIGDSQGLADSLDNAIKLPEDSSDYTSNSDGFGGGFSGGSSGGSSGGGGGAGGF